MKSKPSKIVTLLLTMLLPGLLLAQTVVSGRVIDGGTSTPLSGATVSERGKRNSTQTDQDGKFSLTVASSAAQLLVSYVGYVNQTVNAGTDMTVTLAVDNTRMSEVVVTGLATSVKRTNLANAVASVNAKELVGTTEQATLDGALYGKFPGANISANSGAPGGGISMKLRGITSLVANSQPLFIVDGVYFDNSSIRAGLNPVSKAAGQGSTAYQDDPSNRLADLDPQDIDRVEILKGASAAAIYGSKAAGGVVIITTKRGKSGKPRIELSHAIGMQVQLRKLGSRSWDDAKVLDAYGQNALDYFIANNRKIYDYEEELYGEKGLMNNSRVSISGGSDKTTYFAGYTRKEDEGIMKRTGYNKSSFRLNLTQKVGDFLDLALNMNYIESESNRGFFNNDNTGATIGISYGGTPWFQDLHPDANGNYPASPFGYNFLQTRDLVTNRENIKRVLTGGSATWKVFKNDRNDFRIIARAGIDNYTLNTNAIFPQVLQFESNGNGTNGASIYGTTIARNTNYNLVGVHEFTPNDKMSFRTQLGLTEEKVNLNNVINTATQLVGTQTNLAQAASIQAEQAITLQRDWGIFVQEEFNYNDIVIATLGVRGDKSSRNGDPDHLYYYPKASLALNIHEMSFWNPGTISQLKVRGAYGRSGNFAPFGAIYTPLPAVIYNGAVGSLITLTRGNESLNPETQQEFELGLDMGVLKNKINLEFTYYRKNVKDLLLNVEVPSSSGFSLSWANVATIVNNGFEIGLNVNPISTKDFKWTSQTNFWTNDAEVTQLGVPAFNVGAFGASLGTYRIQQGKSPTQIVGIAGPNDKEIDPSSGLAVYGDAEPDFQMSMAHNLSYKNWEFSVLMHWKQGGKIVNLSALLSDFSQNTPDFDEITLDPSHTLTNGNYRLANFGTSAAPFVEDGSYFRVREIGLAYRLPKAWFKNVADIKVGLSGRNLINAFKYSSYDPEVSNFGTNAISSNVEVDPFPSSKSYNFEITVNF